MYEDYNGRSVLAYAREIGRVCTVSTYQLPSLGPHGRSFLSPAEPRC